MLHLDLIKAGDIPDPFLKNNYPSVKWVSECSVSYKTTFTVDENRLTMNYHSLIF